ncbi:PP2C family protein-serine/threonine phosphatase [Streptomyces albidoflavus]|uniref:PP2C family protein-serine/threonine phosphatase n=1 Tax=Streptomyces albidoflavus TaxID=1886 RepID=UPI0013E3D23C|nr:PP2C family protein-serine/threonine phosphatase [Streptomyces albidoflavus]
MSGAAPRTGGNLLALLPPALIVGGLLADLVGPQPYTGLPLLAAAPLAACIVLTFRGAAVIAVLSVVSSVAIDLALGRPATALVVDVADVLVISLIGLWLRPLMDRRDRSLTLTRDIAEAAQLAVLPQPPPRVGPLLVATRYQGAHEGARIGGDFFAVQDTRYGVRLMIGDVRGQGLPAVSMMSTVVGAFRENARQAPSLHELARRLDTAAERAGGEEDDGFAEEFTTVLLGEIPPDGDQVVLLSRGHLPPYLVADGRVAPLSRTTPGTPLGAGLPGPDNAETDTFPLPSGASLLLITDGVTEARDRHGVFYDPATGLAGRSFDEPQELVDTVVREVTAWSGGRLHDDMAVLAVTRPGGPPGARRA